ncbi:tellurite resistance/C4-dicarboxylate transporter family protein [Dokdonella sp.]|uniref:tellurite resistance/C4-dicarboxylate transporter family protein n=1 Tax=Dokdonella sp. TaxID=2291710 RepID=UPI0031C59032|nr:tellurite resistance/C4-dicarboxylate transporter family protein [Dokdonella sp.]
MSIRHALQVHARNLDPGCFAAVMATGIASVDAAQHGFQPLAQALLALNLVLFAWLLALSLWRLACHPRAMWRDLCDASRGAGYLTLVAGLCVLGSQFVIVASAPALAWACWLVAGVIWIALSQAFFAAMITRRDKPEPAQAITGGWLVVIVATEALAVLASLLGAQDATMLFAGMALFLLGCAFYLWLGTLVMRRMVFLPLTPEGLRAPYWIVMGALAIITLAGSLLMQQLAATAFDGVRPFITGFTLLAWAAASWWFMQLALLWCWRHVIRRLPLRHEADAWNIAFPVGMYTVGSFELARALNFVPLAALADAGVYLNLAVWGLIALGSFVHGLRSIANASRTGATA